MNSAELLQQIFDREIARLNGESAAGGLDAAGLKQLEMLVRAYSSFKDQRLASTDPLVEKSTDELLKELDGNPTRKAKAKPDKGGPVEARGAVLSDRRHPEGDEGSI